MYFSPVGWACTLLSRCESCLLSATSGLIFGAGRAVLWFLQVDRQLHWSERKKMEFNGNPFYWSLFSFHKFVTLSIIERIWRVRHTFLPSTSVHVKQLALARSNLDEVSIRIPAYIQTYRGFSNSKHRFSGLPTQLAEKAEFSVKSS
jgi:hypothetical protein